MCLITLSAPGPPWLLGVERRPPRGGKVEPAGAKRRGSRGNGCIPRKVNLVPLGRQGLLPEDMAAERREE